MITIDVPGFKTLQLSHLVLDYNGTLACDGKLLEGVKDRLNDLSKQLDILVLTADTFGKARRELKEVCCRLEILSKDSQAENKLKYIEKLDANAAAAIGNGRNDCLMLKRAALGIAVLQEEGAAVETINAADILSPDIASALNLLSHPLRLIATLRS